MDEVDGMSAGDRGGVGALNALIKKSKVCFKYQIVPKVDSPFRFLLFASQTTDKLRSSSHS